MPSPAAVLAAFGAKLSGICTLIVADDAIAVKVHAAEPVETANIELLRADNAVAINVSASEPTRLTRFAASLAYCVLVGNEFVRGDAAIAIGVDGGKVMGELGIGFSLSGKEEKILSNKDFPTLN